MSSFEKNDQISTSTYKQKHFVLPSNYLCYPPVNDHILSIITNFLKINVGFYMQVLELMKQLDLSLLSEAFDVSVDVQLNPNNETNSEESEIETDFDFKNKTVPPKRMNLGAKSNHVRRKTLLQKYSVTIPTKSCPKEPKLDSFKILPNRKKIQILYSKVSTNHIVEIGKASKEEPFTILTDEVIINTRLTKDQFSIWPIFNDYEAGIKSNKLYVKNLANNVTESDLKSIFHRHILDSTDEIDIKLFRQGFLKGQCFVTFKLFENTLKRREAEKLIEKARKEAHGFILKNKPMYVVYGRYRKPLKITV